MLSCWPIRELLKGIWVLKKTKLQVRRRMWVVKKVEYFCKFCEACAGYRRGPAPKQGYIDHMVMGAPVEMS